MEKPKVIIYTKGGLLRWIMADIEVDALYLDGDIEGEDEKNLYKWIDIDNQKNKAFVSHLGKVTVNKKFVQRVYEEVEKQV